MKLYNQKGVWWCPYCTELRKFKYRKQYTVEGITMPDPGMYCPLCGISHRDHHVRKHNPAAQMMEYRNTKRISKPNDVKAEERRARRERRRQRRLQERA